MDLIDQSHRPPRRGIARAVSLLAIVLHHAPRHIDRDAGVEGAVGAPDDI
jgi:hypothetical protein